MSVFNSLKVIAFNKLKDNAYCYWSAFNVKNDTFDSLNKDHCRRM